MLNRPLLNANATASPDSTSGIMLRNDASSPRGSRNAPSNNPSKAVIGSRPSSRIRIEPSKIAVTTDSSGINSP